MSVYFPRLISEGNLCWNAWSLPAILTGVKRKYLLRSGGDGDCCNNFFNSFRCIVLDFIWTPREWDSVTVFTSVPCGDPIVFLTVVTVSNEVRVPMNTEKITRPIRNQIMANNFPGMDFGQRSPYLGKKKLFLLTVAVEHQKNFQLAGFDGGLKRLITGRGLTCFTAKSQLVSERGQHSPRITS